MKHNRLNKKMIFIGVILILTLLLQFTFVAAEEYSRSIHLSWQNDPSTTMTIMWRSEPGTEGIVEYGKKPDYTNSVESETHSYRYGRTEIYWHTAELTGLEPYTTYHYRVRISEPWESEDYTFRTAPVKGDQEIPFRFAVMCDAQGGYDNQRKAFEMVKEENVDFILYLGDFTDTGNQEEWDIWFKTGEGVLSEVPLMSVHGNHEGDQKTYWEQFALPGNERWFSIDYGNTHLVFLLTITDTYALEQRSWIIEDLQENDNSWTIVMGHKAIYSAAPNHGCCQYLIDHWVDVFEKYGVDLYFGAHNHCYERTWSIKEGEINSEGITYIVHGPSGDKFYPGESEWWTAAIKPNIPMYSIYSVDEYQIKGEAKSLDGSVVDEFIISK